MKKQKTVFKAILAGAVAVALGQAMARAAATIVVDVNNQPIAFQGSSPLEVNGSILVPLRGVFEALGASVDYDSATKTITANKGASNVVLELGSTTASVSGQSQTLSQPAQVIGGSTLVPLRFVAEALGATVDWNEATSTVEIYTPVANLALLPVPGPQHVIGLVVEVNTSAEPQQIIVRVKGKPTTVFVSSLTTFQLSGPDQSPAPSTIEQLRDGDQVDVTLDPGGVAQVVSASYGLGRGTVASIGSLANNNRMVTLNDGVTVEMARRFRVVIFRKSGKFTDIKAGQTVVIRTNPTDNIGYEIIVVK